MAVAGASRLRGSRGSSAPLLLSSPETAVPDFHGEEFRAGRRHAEPGRVGRPDAGREWLHELLEGFSPQPSNRELFERFVGQASVPHRHEPFAEQPQPTEGRQERRGEDAFQKAGSDQPESERHGLCPAVAKDQCPPDTGIDADEFAGESYTLDERDCFGASGKKTVC